MKTLSTEQQLELQQLFEGLGDLNVHGSVVTLETQAQINYWKNELKAKRVRRVKIEPEGGNG